MYGYTCTCTHSQVNGFSQLFTELSAKNTFIVCGAEGVPLEVQQGAPPVSERKLEPDTVAPTPPPPAHPKQWAHSLPTSAAPSPAAATQTTSTSSSTPGPGRPPPPKPVLVDVLGTLRGALRLRGFRSAIELLNNNSM